MNRRQWLKGLLAAPMIAVAARLGLDAKPAEWNVWDEPVDDMGYHVGVDFAARFDIGERVIVTGFDDMPYPVQYVVLKKDAIGTLFLGEMQGLDCIKEIA